MKPNEEYEATLRFLRRIFRLLGQDIFAKDYRRTTIMYAIAIFLILIFICLASVSLDEKNYVISIRIMATVYGICLIQVCTKYIWIQNLRKLQPTINFFADIHRKNSEPTDQYYPICNVFAHRLRLVVSGNYVLYIVITSALWCFGMIQMFQSDGKIMLSQVYIPGCYDYSGIGLAFMIVLNTCYLFALALLTAPPDCLFYTIFGHVPMVPAIVRCQMTELTMLLRQEFKTPNADHDFIRRRFLHFIGIHHKYNE